MNDPGLDEPIQETSKTVEQEFVGDDSNDNNDGDEKQDGGGALTDGLRDEDDDERAFLNPSRWWFSSTAFPLIAGTIGPMASAFNICALVESWRVDIPPGFGANEAHGVTVPDPKW